MTKTQPKTNWEQLALAKREIIDVVEANVNSLTAKGALLIPEGYSPENAMKAAWLILQETKTKAGDPVLEACTQHSIVNSLLAMVVQGLSPTKKQCYFIAYGKSLTCQRSYFGTMAMLKRVRPDISDIVAETIHEGDKVIITIENGRKSVDEHKQEFGAADKPLLGAYCVILGKDDQPIRTEVMTLEQIKAAWRQSQMNPVDEHGELKESSTHSKFTTEMSKKTVISRACKALLNSSGDYDLVSKVLDEIAEAVVDDELAGEIEDNANSEVIDITDGPEGGCQDSAVVDAEMPDGPDFTARLVKMADIDEDVLTEAMKACGVDPTDEICEEEFDRVSKKFNELFDIAQEQPGKGAKKEF